MSDVHRNRSYLDWAKHVGELADHLGIDRFAVLGYSSGGPYAAAVAHELPERVTVAGIAAGEGPYASDDFPQTVLSGDAFSGSMLNKVLILGAQRAPWLMRGVWSAVRVFVLRDPVAFLKSTTDAKMPEHDLEFFSRDDVGDTLAEAFRQGSLAATQDHNIERRSWPFELEGIQQTPVLVFHGERDTTVDPGIAEYVCSRIPSCGGPTLYPGEGHSVVHYRYEETIREMLEAGA